MRTWRWAPILAVLVLSGGLRFRRRAVAASVTIVLAAALLSSAPAHVRAQATGEAPAGEAPAASTDDFASKAALHTRLAYVITGDPEIDRTSASTGAVLYAWRLICSAKDVSHVSRIASLWALTRFSSDRIRPPPKHMDDPVGRSAPAGRRPDSREAGPAPAARAAGEPQAGRAPC